MVLFDTKESGHAHTINTDGGILDYLQLINAKFCLLSRKVRTRNFTIA